MKKFLDDAPRLGNQMVLNRRAGAIHRRRLPERLVQAVPRTREGEKPGLTFHGFTRTRVGEMYKAGATKVEVMAALGHTTPKMVDVYLQEIESER